MFNLFGKSPSLDDLIARKKYAQALVVLREQFRRKSPDTPAREKFAELLILADRRAEAIPILLGLADEHLRFGFVDKAKDALGRIEKLERGRSDVAQRLRRIAKLAQAQAPTENRVDGESWLAAKDDGPQTPPLDRAEPEGPKDDPVEVVPEPLVAAADACDCDEPIHLELTGLDLSPRR
jgi:hypothetical protein